MHKILRALRSFLLCLAFPIWFITVLGKYPVSYPDPLDYEPLEGEDEP